MGLNRFIADKELWQFCFWKKRVFRNDSSAHSFRIILKTYFVISGSKADELIKRIITLGYAEYLEDEEGLNPDTTTIIKILV